MLALMKSMQIYTNFSTDKILALVSNPDLDVLIVYMRTGTFLLASLSTELSRYLNTSEYWEFTCNQSS